MRGKVGGGTSPGGPGTYTISVNGKVYEVLAHSQPDGLRQLADYIQSRANSNVKEVPPPTPRRSIA